MLTRFRKISLFLAYLVATIPLWHYISETHILLLMTAVVIFAYLNVVLSSVDAAQTILTSEKAKTPLPRWLPNKPKYEKWWLVMRHTLKWHLLLVPAKMGLALGFMEVFYRSWIDGIPFATAYFYYDGMMQSFFPSLYPQLETIIVSLVIVLIFTMCETALLASIILCSRKYSQKSLFVFLARLSLIFLSIGFGNVTLNPIESNFFGDNYYCRPTPVLENGHLVFEDGEDTVFVVSIQDSRCNPKRLIETVYLSLITPYDQGVLLAANSMRPWGQVTYADVGSQRISGDKQLWDNRLFVLRQCVAGLLGILLYLGTTWVILWFAEDEPTFSQRKTM